jgi:hypothetical protein
MKTKTFKIILPLFFLFSIGLMAQNSSSLWSPITPEAVEMKAKELRNSTPTDYLLYTLNEDALLSILENAPSRKNSGYSNVVISLPNVDGTFSNFRVFEAPTLSDELQAEFPSIRSFVARGIDDPTAIARFSHSQVGLHVAISSGNHPTIYIDPFTQDKEQYITYSRRDIPMDVQGFVCHTEDFDNRPADIDDYSNLELLNANDGKLRTFRLALACTAQYSNFHLNNQGVPASATDEVKKAAVLSAMNVTMTRVNGIFERDLSLTMEIIPNNTEIIYLNTATQPFTGNNNGLTLLNEAQGVIDNAIGFTNYDIGHVFSTGGGGIAPLNSPCTANKARGVTGLPQPIGDSFNVDYVAHEMGHQYGAGHTQNNNCQRSAASAMEPGSASTILGYAGICPPNVQNFSDDYFHAISIFQMWNFIKNGSGQCAAQSDTNNLPPIADAGPNRTIPRSTPFVLRGTATDPDTPLNELTYTWEQMNPQVGQMPPQATNTLGPMFRSYPPSASSDRYMPRLQVVVNNSPSPWEVLNSVSRSLTFRLTVRDNFIGGSATASDNMTVSVNANAGPFVVTSQNTIGIQWTINTTRTVTWNVANTDQTPINCATVDILLSLNGGQTFPIVLASGVPNNGSYDLTVPNQMTTQARIMVACSNNIFYNVNSRNFEITDQLSNEEFSFTDFSIWPNPSTGVFNLSFVPATADKIEVALYDVSGRLIKNNVFDNNSDRFNTALDYSDIGSGLYFISVSNGEFTTSKKLIKK